MNAAVAPQRWQPASKATWSSSHTLTTHFICTTQERPVSPISSARAATVALSSQSLLLMMNLSSTLAEWMEPCASGTSANGPSSKSSGLKTRPAPRSTIVSTLRRFGRSCLMSMIPLSSGLVVVTARSSLQTSRKAKPAASLMAQSLLHASLMTRPMASYGTALKTHLSNALKNKQSVRLKTKKCSQSQHSKSPVSPFSFLTIGRPP